MVWVVPLLCDCRTGNRGPLEGWDRTLKRGLNPRRLGCGGVKGGGGTPGYPH